MSGPAVDVLAVLDHIADCDYIPVSTVDLNATRAAVAELIEAAKAVDATKGSTSEVRIRLRLALANVGSAP